MKLRKAWLLFPILLLATAVQADPVSTEFAAPNNAIYGSLNFQNSQMTTTLAPSSHAGQSVELFSAGPTILAPEPATLALFGTGLMGIATLVRFRTRRSGAGTRHK